jgi:bla regulator protein blaR1
MLPIGFGALQGQAGPGSNPGGSNTEVRGDLPKYEVSTVKPASGEEGRSLLHLTPDGTSIQGVPVHMLLRFAFGVEPDRIIGSPAWTTSNRYDIEAKVAPEDAPKLEKLTVEERRAMLLPLLAERFNLKYHHETRELPMYLLVVAKGGPKLAESKEPPTRPSPNEAGPGRVPTGPLSLHGSMRMMPGRIESEGSTLDMLTHALSGPLGHTVVDKTGLTGKYDYTLQWALDDAAMPMPGGPGGGPAGAAGHEANVVEAGGPSLLTAIEEQLGLKVESTKGQVDVIVIDHLDLPSAN